ncbi:MAG: hypothetical protein QHH18_00935 [Candidatus Bathyarchaeota archaeon]|jgi:hypothetical protein|nr:hypothetical protein [Candidatus Bathyarchaeota archaeon A05DMB-5]MDH7557159.1 hypothetical protein [Candidatus Bathyarchaeota archaeon]
MQSRIDEVFCLKRFLLPKNNHWLRRTVLVFAFIFFDYLSTLMFCRAPHEEANLYARAFMENFGIFSGLTLFVLVADMPIYMVLSVDSHVIKLPPKIAMVIEPLVDVLFAWFIAGLHFSGGTSWFWYSPDLLRQALGAVLYGVVAFLFVKPHIACNKNKLLV